MKTERSPDGPSHRSGLWILILCLVLLPFGWHELTHESPQGHSIDEVVRGVSVPEPVQPTIETSSDIPPDRSEVETRAANAWQSGVLNGRVISPTGEPISNCIVTVRARSWRASRHRESVTDRWRASTDKNGSFSAVGLPLRKVITLSVIAEGFAQRNSLWIGALDSMEPMDLGELMLEREAIIRGVVVDEQENPIAGAEIRDHGNCLPDPPAVTGSDGRFEIRGVYAYRYSLKAAAAGYVPAMPPFPERDVRSGSEWEGIRFVLSRGASVTGRTVNDNGTPLAGVKVSAHHAYAEFTSDGHIGGSSTAVAWSDSAGWFSVPVARKAEATISFDSDGYEQSFTTIAAHNPSAHKLGNVALRPLRRIRFTMRDLKGRRSSPGRHGVLLNFDPPAKSSTPHRFQSRYSGRGSIVQRFSPSNPSWLDDDHGFSILTELQGRFRVTVGSDHGQDPHGPFETGDDHVSGPFPIVLPFAASVAGSVIDEHGRGVAARVELAGAKGYPVLARSVTDALGRFAMTGPNIAMDGAAIIRVNPLLHVEAERAVPGLIPGQAHEIDPIIVEDGSSVHVLTLDPNGEPLPGASVGLWMEDGTHREFMTDATGRVIATGLPAGLWRSRITDAFLNVRTAGTRPPWLGTAEKGDVVTRLKIGEHTELKLTASRSGLSQVYGAVSVAGAPLAGCSLTLHRDEGHQSSPPEFLSGPNGVFHSPWVRADTLRVTVARARNSEPIGSATVAVTPGQARRVDIDLQPSRLTVRIVAPVDGPIPYHARLTSQFHEPRWSEDEDERVEFWRSAKMVSSGDSTISGNLLFDDLPPGKWLVEIDELGSPDPNTQAHFVHLRPSESRELTVHRVSRGRFKIELQADPNGETIDQIFARIYADQRGGHAELRATREDGLRIRKEIDLDQPEILDQRAGPGRWRVQIVHVTYQGEDRVLGETTLDVSSGELTEQAVILRGR